ncbi:MAG: Rieske (2Fe-2S) protein [Dehalococcoidales bacterium]
MSVFKAILGICETKELDSTSWRMDGGKVVVKLEDAPELNRKGGAIYLKGGELAKPLLLVRAEDGSMLAFANRCSHLLGRKVDPVPGESRLRCCSLGHSEYGYDGQVIKGPAKEPLKKYTVEIDNGDIVVTL